MKIKVSDVIANFLAAKKVSHVFGIIGAGNVHIFDSIANLGESQLVCVHHEQAATMAMQTYYKTCGVPTASILTTGAGATNSITGVVGAWMDSVPGLIIAGNEASRHTREANPLRIYGVQGFDAVEMVRKVTKYAVRVTDPKRILFELEKAYCLATSGRPGPCWIEIPMDIQSTLIEQDELLLLTAKERETLLRPPAMVTQVTLSESVAAVAAGLREAKRPLLWLGIGIRLAGAASKMQEFLEQVRVPSLVSWSGIDLIDSNHPLSMVEQVSAVIGAQILYCRTATIF